MSAVSTTQTPLAANRLRLSQAICRRIPLAPVVTLLALLPFFPASAATVLVWPDSPNPAPPYAGWGTAARTIQDAVDAAQPGDTVLATNGIYSTGGKAVYGLMTNRVAVTKAVIVQSVNGPEVTVIQGRQVPGTTNGDGAIRCVYLTNGATLSGFTLTHGATRYADDWYSEEEQTGGGVWCEPTNVLVTNCALSGNSAHCGGGAYFGTLSHCTLSSNSALGSGGGAASGALFDCSLSGNVAYSGGGAYSSLLSNCALVGNVASSGGGTYLGTLNACIVSSNTASEYGGGTDFATVNNSTFNRNSAGWSGGGAFAGTLNNCTLTGNSADYGGGASYGTFNNCIVYYNTAASFPNYYLFGATLAYCCTTPLPATGSGNITNEPLFVDSLHGNLRLQPNSPCINAGANGYVSGPADLDGFPRIAGGTVDLEAYEFQTPVSVISYAWLAQFGLPTDGSADFTDPDGDGLNNWQEWLSGTDPTNGLSVLRLLPATDDGSGVNVTWRSITNRSYFLERSTNLGVHPAFQPLASGIVGQAGTTTFTDTNAPGSAPIFYRVGTQR